MRTAIGKTAGPLMPPTLLRRMGLREFISILMPRSVFMSETASAPAASTDFAMSAMLVTLGESFTTRGFFVALRTFLVTSAAISQLVPNAAPPCLTFGQEIFSSIM